MGYIYIISNPDYQENTYKVGYTKNKNQNTKKDPRKSLKQRYSTYSAYEPVIEELYEINDDNCEQAEKILFELLKNYRVNKKREFFKCDLYHIKECCIRTQELVKTTCDFHSSNQPTFDKSENIKKIPARPKTVNRRQKKEQPRPFDFLFQDVKKDIRKKGNQIKREMEKEGLMGTIIGSIVNNGIKKISDSFDTS